MKPAFYTPVKPMVIAAICQHNGCADPALRVPRLCVPVRGHPRAQPFAVLIDLQLCRFHMSRLPVSEYLTPLLRGACKHILRQAGCEPDFPRARFASIHIMSEEYRIFQRQAHGDLPGTPGERILFDGKLA